MKRSQPRRDWRDARDKVEAEGRCRVCGSTVWTEAAHISDRQCDRFAALREAGPVHVPVYADRKTLHVHPDRIVPLCGPATDTNTCHGREHAHTLDLLPYLTLPEQLQAVADEGGIELARRRTAPSQYGQRRQAA